MNRHIIELRSQRGGRLIAFQDFLYNEDVREYTNYNYRCQKRTCSARLQIIGQEIPIIEGTHNHSDMRSRIIHMQTKLRIEARAVDTNEGFTDSLVSIVEEYTDNDVERLAQVASYRKNYRDAQREAGLTINRNAENIPEQLINDNNGNSFVHFDSGTSD